MKDIFKGKIQKQYYRYVKFTIILVGDLFLVFGIFILMMALFYDKVEPSARIFMYVLASLSLLSSLLYPLLTLLAIKMYPKHTKFAYGMLKEFVFETPESKVIETIKSSNNLSATDFPLGYELMTENIIKYIPSKEIRKYLLKHKKKLTIMQYATLVENYFINKSFNLV